MFKREKTFFIIFLFVVAMQSCLWYLTRRSVQQSENKITQNNEKVKRKEAEMAEQKSYRATIVETENGIIIKRDNPTIDDIDREVTSTLSEYRDIWMAIIGIEEPYDEPKAKARMKMAIAAAKRVKEGEEKIMKLVAEGNGRYEKIMNGGLIILVTEKKDKGND